ncbi:MAG TPA: polysaccharide deacetylase family protein [Candidatus Angelobacter sp.]|nr:polysaccharide deacetylase family protein [Candidatus Angelobacter sp.]
MISVAQQVALTFDDLPAHGPLPPGMTRLELANNIVATLKAAKSPPVYGFINASKLESVPEDRAVLEAWRAAGYLLGNHTYTHMSLTDNSTEAFEKDVAANEPVLRSLMSGEDWHWFRYPFLWEGETLEKRNAVRAYLKVHGYRVAQVTLDFEDYAWNAPYARCLAKNDQRAISWLKSSYLSTAQQYIEADRQMSELVFNREIKYVMLLHLGGFQTVMLPQLLDLLKQKGFRLVTLEEAESDPAYQTNPNAGLKYGGSLLEQMMEAKHLPFPQVPPKPMKELDAACR